MKAGPWVACVALALASIWLCWTLVREPGSPLAPGAAVSGAAESALPPTPAGSLTEALPAAPERSPAFDASRRDAAAADVLAALPRDVTPRSALFGRVVDERRSPVPEARVALADGGIARTDGEGRWRIEVSAVSSSRLLVLADAEGFVSGTFLVPVPGPADVEVPDFVLLRPQPIEGRVVDAEAKPVAHAHVEMRCESRALSMEGYETGEDGRFRFPHATSGTWLLHVSPTNQYGCWDATPEQPVAAGDLDVLVVMKPAEAGAAEVVAEIVDGESGEALLPERAQLSRGEGAEISQCAAHGNVALENGVTRIEGCHPGTWRLWVLVRSRTVGFADFDIARGQSLAKVRIEIGRPGSLTGRVLAEEGADLREIRVAVHPPDADLYDRMPDWRSEGAILARTSVLPDGSFRFERLAPGRMIARLEGRGIVGSALVDVLSGSESRVEVPAMRGARLVFRTRSALPKEHWIFPCTSEGSMNWRTWPYTGAAEGSETTWELTAAPGHVQWYIRFVRPDHKTGMYEESFEPQFGEIDVEAGESLEIPLAIVPR